MSLAVYCDFDGTITQYDTIDCILETLALPEWRELESLWQEGAINSRECMSEQIRLIQGSWQDIQDVLDTIPLRTGFVSFYEWCLEHRIPFTIVSDGLDPIIRHMLQGRISVLPTIVANQLIEQSADRFLMGFPFLPNDPLTCGMGVCKCQVVDANTPKNTGIVIIGDGLSDSCWIQHAHHRFARGSLVMHCEENHLAYTPFETFDGILASLNQLLSTTSMLEAGLSATT